ncbi:MAG: proteasome assembly chaperone family protein [Thermoplasmata archaeon]|nr:proteasome assembly chaperone family protein [Thermoplasmata archaeon]
MKDIISLYEYKKIDISNSLVVIGFPTVGVVGTIASRFIIDALKLDIIGAFSSDFFYPVTVVSKGRPLPPVRIYGGNKKCGIDGGCDQIVIITSEFFPPMNVMRPLANKILEWCENRNCSSIVTIEGFNMANGSKEVPLFGVASTKEGREFLKKQQVELMEEGMVSGISGVLLYEGEIKKVNSMCLLAGVHSDFPDARAAAKVLEVVNKMIPEIEIDPEPLYEEAGKIEEEIEKHMQKAKPRQSFIQTSPMYG